MPRLSQVQMPIERYFLDEPLEEHDTKLIMGAEFHHLAHVLRTRVGDAVEIVNGRGVLAQATLQSLAKDRAVVRIEELQEETAPSNRIILAQALPKLNRLDFILEKGTELGVDEFWLFPGQLSQKKEFSANQFERACSITIAALKQCGRLTLPLIKILPALEKWSQINGIAFFGHTGEDAELFCYAWARSQQTISGFPITFFVGPESGWSPEEILLLKSKGVQAVKLHSNVLRTDTASLVAISLIHHWMLAS
ncbi:MAG: RsmE family RNA methyltransferase [Chlamydiales bacterium]